MAPNPAAADGARSERQCARAPRQADRSTMGR